MKARKLLELGVPPGPAVKAVIAALPALGAQGLRGRELRRLVAELARSPEAFLDHPELAGAARALLEAAAAAAAPPPPRRLAPWRGWGADLDPAAIKQMDQACSLPVSLAGALMPDAHLGYGLPIGGVLATREAVIPYAVGVDIACRVRLTVLDWPAEALEQRQEELVRALETQTRFGVGAGFQGRQRRQHPVMDEDWSAPRLLAGLKDLAWEQLGSSGSGNHFADFGLLAVPEAAGAELGLASGAHLALLTHSGSRGSGARVADHFSKLARRRRPELPRELAHLAWLELGSEEGQAYWSCMELMGRYAAANHELIHRHLLRALGARAVLAVENHHNFAWLETHGGQRVVVHRKGATPAAAGVLGVIPGTMADPGYLVRGLGEPASLHSAAHGAGRAMSRGEARSRFRWAEARALLAGRGVRLLSAGLDEVPMAYKPIAQVMAAQADLVRPLASFQPRLVKMAAE